MTSQWIPKIESEEDAKKLTKQGAIGVLLFAAMNLLGVVLVYFASKSPVDGSTVNAQGVQQHLIGAFINIPILLFFAWRVYVGKGWLVASLVLVWLIVEVLFKLVGGTTNFGWMFFYFFLSVMLVYGVRGCWWLAKKRQPPPLPAEQNDT
ncbi:MAG: hypothetical protein NT064_04425 [Proteobacteria bacterium]|nr:hypothetical protein [Pseudomonadota bacterium]